MHEMRQCCKLHIPPENLNLGNDSLKLWHFFQLPDFVGVFYWLTGERRKMHAWQAQNSQGKKDEAICILIMFESRDYKVSFMTFERTFKVS